VTSAIWDRDTFLLGTPGGQLHLLTLDRRLRHGQGAKGQRLGRFVRRGDHVTASFADCGEHFLEHPPPEANGRRQFTFDDEPEHVRFIQDAKFLRATRGQKGVAFHHPLAMLLHGVRWIGIPHARRNVGADEVRFTFNGGVHHGGCTVIVTMIVTLTCQGSRRDFAGCSRLTQRRMLQSRNLESQRGGAPLDEAEVRRLSVRRKP